MHHVRDRFMKGFSCRAAGWAAAAFFALAIPVQASEIRTLTLPSPALGKPWRVNVYVPDRRAAQTPLILLLHGRGDNAESWKAAGDIQRTLDQLIAQGRIPPSVVVMPDGFTCWYLDRPDCRMLTAIMKELLPYVEKAFAAGTTRETRYVVGFSMGGYGALNLALQYPVAFAGAGLLSPAAYTPLPPENSTARKDFGKPGFDEADWIRNSYTARLPAYFAQPLRVRFFVHSGDDDPFFIEDHSARLHGVMRRRANPAELRIVNGGHGWDVWKAGLADALTYFFDGQKETRP